MSMFSDNEWTKKGNIEARLHSAQEVAALAIHFQARTLVLPGARIGNYVVERKFQADADMSFSGGECLRTTQRENIRPETPLTHTSHYFSLQHCTFFHLDLRYIFLS